MYGLGRSAGGNLAGLAGGLKSGRVKVGAI